MAATVLLVFAGLLPLAATQQCFNLDGTPTAGVDFVPCDPAPGAVSMCCALNRAPLAAGTQPNPASPPPDLCLANGLCQGTAFDAEGNARGLFVRESCSRADWAGCLKNVCPGSAAGDIAMTACGTNNQTTRWCCGDNNVACCRAWPNHVDAATIPLNFAAGVSASATIGRFTVINPTPTADSGLSAQPTAGGPTAVPTGVDAPGLNPGTPGDASGGSELVTGSTGLSTQAIAGIAAGVVVVVVILVTIGCFTAESIYKKRNRIFRAERRGSLKNKIRLGWDRDSPERAGQIA